MTEMRSLYALDPDIGQAFTPEPITYDEAARIRAALAAGVPPSALGPPIPPGMPQFSDAPPPSGGLRGSLGRAVQESGLNEALPYYAGPHLNAALTKLGLGAALAVPGSGTMHDANAAAREAELGNYGKAAAATALGTAGGLLDFIPGAALAKNIMKGLTGGTRVLTDVAPTLGAALTVARPNVGKISDLFDYSPQAMRAVPDVPQFNLERYEPPRGVPERTQALADKANVRRVNAVVKKGAEMGGPEWYNTEQLRDAFIDELGAKKGAPAYSQYMDLVAATSPRSNVGTNARNASYYYGLAQRGEPLPARAPDGSLIEPLPAPYGHIAQRLHVQNAENVLNQGGWPVLQNPKPASFSQNLQGNQMPVTVDAHNARIWGMVDSKGRPVDLPSNTEYGFMEQLQQREAAKMGMSPAQYQASAWVGGGEETGLKSTADPFLKVFEQRVNLTAQKTGLSPKEVLRRTIRGEMPLLSLVPAAAAVPALHALQEDPTR